MITKWHPKYDAFFHCYNLGWDSLRLLQKYYSYVKMVVSFWFASVWAPDIEKIRKCDYFIKNQKMMKLRFLKKIRKILQAFFYWFGQIIHSAVLDIWVCIVLSESELWILNILWNMIFQEKKCKIDEIAFSQKMTDKLGILAYIILTQLRSIIHIFKTFLTSMCNSCFKK